MMPFSPCWSSFGKAQCTIFILTPHLSCDTGLPGLAGAGTENITLYRQLYLDPGGANIPAVTTVTTCDMQHDLYDVKSIILSDAIMS